MSPAGHRTAPLAAVLAVLALALGAQGCSGSDGAANGKPFVRSDAQRTVTVWAVGDGPDGGSAAAAVAELIRKDKPDRVLYLGDVYDSGTRHDFEDNVAPLYGPLGKRVAPTPGNHDWPNHSEGYDPYWSGVIGKPVKHYYAFESGGWDIISLNSESGHDAASSQVRWLRGRLKGRKTCRLAFWHRPRYNAGEVHGDAPDVQPFWNALRRHAAIVVNGHEHNMQRFKPRRKITEFVSGAGGHGHYGLVSGRRGLAFGNATKDGALRLALAPGVARYRFVATSGKVLDSGTVRCRA
jgi:hypothetical protein